MPRVSVIMPAYNQAEYLKRAIDSVLAQTFSDFEFIINDNGSTDKTYAIIDKAKDKRIKLLRNKQNVGSFWGVEQCVSVAKGKYLAYIGSDDVWEKSKLEKQVTFLDSNPDYGAVFTETRIINEKDDPQNWTPFLCSNDYTRYQWLRYFYNNVNAVCWASCMLRKSVKPEATVALSRYKQLCDFYQWILILQSSNIKILPEVLTNYRQHGKNESMHDSDTLNKRSSVEQYHIIDSFYFFRVDELLGIFPELQNYRRIINEENKKFFLALISLQMSKSSHSYQIRKLHATLQIFNEYKNDLLASDLKKYLNFSLDEFMDISGNGLICKYVIENDREKVTNDNFIIKHIAFSRMIKLLFKKIIKRII